MPSMRLTLLCVLFLAACVPRRPPAGSADAGSRVVIRPDEVRVRAEDELLSTKHGYTAGELFLQAFAAFEAADLPRAAALYDRLSLDFPDAPEAQPARYNAALAWERLGKEDEAVTRWEAWIARPASGEPEDAVRARLRLAHCQQALGRFSESEAPLRETLARTTLGEDDRWEAMLLLARADVEGGRVETAESALFRVRQAIDTSTREEGIHHGWHASMMWFVTGEAFRTRARAVVLDRVEDLGHANAKVDEKARWLLDARGAYRKAIAHRVGDWGGEAAIALGGVFEDFRDDFLLAPLPADLDPAHAPVYREMLEGETLVFLEKAAADYEALLRDARKWDIGARAVEKLQAAVDRCRQEIARLKSRPTPGAAESTDGAAVPTSP